MYTHLAKDFTVGQVLTRRLCRLAAGACGIPMDVLIRHCERSEAIQHRVLINSVLDCFASLAMTSNC
jgi:hypothetical protein